MNKYTKEELIEAKFQGLTMGDLAEFVYKNPQIPRDAKVLVERIQDVYFEGVDISGMNSAKGILPKGSKSEGWKVLPVKGENYYNTKNFNEVMIQEVEDRKNGKESQYPKIDNPNDYIIELSDDCKEQFFPAWCISKENDDSIVYIFNHY